MDDYEALGIELDSPDPLDGSAVLQSLQTDAPDLLTPGGLPYSRCTQAVMQAADAGTMTATFVIVTRGADANRHGNMVQIAESKYGRGLRLDEYQHNPVVMLDHGAGYNLPIGRSMGPDGKLAIKLQKTKATGTVHFSQQSQVAEDVFRLVDEGTLRMASIGFMPMRAMLVKQRKQDNMPEGVEDLNRYRGYDFVESMLWEWSITAIGADAGALRQCLDCGKVAGKTFHPLLRPMLQRYAEQRPAWSPGVTFEEERRIGDAVHASRLKVEETSEFAEFMQRIGDHLEQRVTQAIERRLTVEEPPAEPEPDPETQHTCSCRQNGVDTAPPDSTLPANEAMPVVTTQQIADAIRDQPTDADPLGDAIRQAITDTVTPAVAELSTAIRQQAARLEQMTGKLPV